MPSNLSTPSVLEQRCLFCDFRLHWRQNSSAASECSRSGLQQPERADSYHQHETKLGVVGVQCLTFLPSPGMTKSRSLWSWLSWQSLNAAAGDHLEALEAYRVHLTSVARVVRKTRSYNKTWPTWPKRHHQDIEIWLFVILSHFPGCATTSCDPVTCSAPTALLALHSVHYQLPTWIYLMLKICSAERNLQAPLEAL